MGTEQRLRKLILNEEIPGGLRQAIDEDAIAQNITLNDAVTKVLAEHFQSSWRPSGWEYRPTSPRFRIRVRDDLHRAMRIEAAKRLITIRGLALSVLAEHYGVEAIDPNRRPRREAV